MDKNLIEVSDLMEVAITKSRHLKEGILKSQWEKVVGELSKKSFVIFLKDKKLFVGVENSIWIQQMTFQKKSIIEKINDFLGDDYIKDIVFKIGKKNPEDYFLNEEKLEETEEFIGLASITLTEEEQLEVETKLLELEKSENKISNEQDENIKIHTRKLLEKSFKRRKYLKLHGYKKCKCGAYYNSQDYMCTICINKKKVKLEEELMGAFRDKKLLKYHQALGKFENISEKEYSRIKLKKLSKLKKDIDIYIKEGKDDVAFDLAKLYMTIDLANLDEDYICRRAKEFLQVLKKI